MINHHSQVDIIQRHRRPTHPIYLCSTKNKMSKINNSTHKDRNIDTIDNMMLTYSWIKFFDVPLVWYIRKCYSRISEPHVVSCFHILSLIPLFIFNIVYVKWMFWFHLPLYHGYLRVVIYRQNIRGCMCMDDSRFYRNFCICWCIWLITVCFLFCVLRHNLLQTLPQIIVFWKKSIYFAQWTVHYGV